MNEAAWRTLLDLRPDSTPAGGLQRELRSRLVTAIRRGDLATGMRLPASRKLAAWLDISRNTVTLAYNTLVQDGLLEARHGSGVYVAQSPPVRAAVDRPQPAQSWVRRPAIMPSLMRQVNKPRDWQSYRYPFISGQVDPELFPVNGWRESSRAAWSMAETSIWSQDVIDADDDALVEAVRLHVLAERGIRAGRDEVLITLGAQQALSLLAQLYLTGGRVAGIEDPGYTDVRNMAAQFASELAPLPVDGQGAIPDAALLRCDIAFLTPGQHCPTNAVMPLDRRRRFLEQAALSGTVLVEDSYDWDHRSEDAPPPLKTLDAVGQVVHVGSFSKSLAPGIRGGFMVAAPDIIAELRALRRMSIRHPPLSDQRILASFLSLGHHDAHLRRIRPILAERAELIRHELPLAMPDCTAVHGPGSHSFWIALPDGQDSQRLLPLAQAEGVLIEPGGVFFADPARGARYFRLGYAAIRTERIVSGIAALARAVNLLRGA
ncbi:GntR family transcriptional regulator [Primorskyibacter flagellatus]|uniref:GntR family transcriptional regulator n=1 Tax=Primorskyibacter flagellatus TaxID=1387277 RepID=A0A917AGQ3_9RHOB|nr:PLP-dependent aminotransferase family protein [Primorskyibacter flagellatus]GGE50204.1 GntR family transcriptional regulator [Primorskyibacter flagellatus]